MNTKPQDRFTVSQDESDWDHKVRWTVWDSETITSMGTFDTRHQALIHANKCRAALSQQPVT